MKMALSILALSFFLGCGTLLTKKEPMTLSGAMKEAANKPSTQQAAPQDTARSIVDRGVVQRGERGEKKKVVHAERGTHDASTEVSGETGATGISLEAGGTAPIESEGVSTERITGYYAGISLGGGSLTGKEVSGFGLFGVKLGNSFGDGKFHAEIQGFLGSANTRQKSDVAASIKNEVTLGWGMGVQYLLTPAKGFMGIYVLGGFRVSYLLYDYASPVHVPGGGTVDQDELRYDELYGGFGLSLAQLKHIQLGVNVSGGHRSYSDATDEGFRNDVFDNEWFVQLTFEALFGRFK